ncbi:DedA family protein [Mammaliicoccus lentus]|jgi:membrane protein DedA with SNARE-associated domain|uniref:DedA family protein n=1 Tax=Mammaliicoccus TaxID=2803850 RepID=UPI0002E5B756|nr:MULTISPECIES: DedA family protein [Mammaliicoccus]HIS17929.1 DedA family protein [Candidatus Coprovivens excrementavium]MBW0766426.1 DedA family protein [Mammaliicoccus lentus]MCD2478921.1 DedA family protein [Mammaliicoccus lentus]WGZ43616.1 DedA family protein [Mammaliicoccus lentus]WHI53654.1 DedA family protein [Mammaliicoccus lentus]
MEQWITDFMTQYGYVGIFILVFLEYIIHPFPSEIVLTFAGFMTTQSNLSIVVVCILAVVGAVLGALVLYGIGAWIGEERIYRLIHKHGKYIGIKTKDLDKTITWLNKYGNWAIFIGRFIPIVRTLISLPAGITKMNIPLFIVLTAIGTGMWNILLIVLGMTLGSHWHKIIEFAGIYSKLFIFIIAIIVLYVLYRWFKRIKETRAD